MNTQELNYAIVRARQYVEQMQCRVELLANDLYESEKDLRHAQRELDELEEMV